MGKNNEICGTQVIKTVMSNKTTIKGRQALATVSSDKLVRLQATNKLTPRGGVKKAISLVNTMIIPKWTGSTPNFMTKGNRIGVRMIIVAAVSINIPKNSKSKLISMRTVSQSLEMDEIRSATFNGT